MFLTTTITTNNSNNNNNNSNNNNNNHSNVLVNAFNNLNLNQLIRFVPNTERVSRFAAHMTCFIWFSDYQQISNNNNNNQNISNCWSSPSSSLLLLSPSSSDIPPGGSHINCRRFNDYKPKDPFRKFCLDVLTTTQISFPAVLLSLLYIHRMKIRNPRIKGQSGSEYRTFTVALMLANKFLDDNTYTNKTWSEVTRIPVSEINTMEIELLTALQYKLFVSLEQYNDWLQKATRFINYGGDDDTNNTNININNNNNCNNDNNINHHHHHYHHHHHHHHQDNNNNHINSNNNNNNNNNIIISQQNHHRNYQILATVIVTPYKRSAQEAFVDDMMISPSKRTNVSRAINNNNNNSLLQFLPLSISSSSSSSNNSNSNNNSYTRTSTINGMATILVN